MRYKAGHKAQARESILDAAGRKLKRDGFHGVGVDGLMAEVGMTSGAFYSNFSSKDELFREVLRRGIDSAMGRLESGLALDKESAQEGLKDFLKNYISSEHRKNVEGGCALPGLTTDASRAGCAAKKLFRDRISALVDQVAQGLRDAPEAKKRRQAWSVLVMMVGAVSMARAMPEGEVADELLGSVYDTLKDLI